MRKSLAVTILLFTIGITVSNQLVSQDDDYYRPTVIIRYTHEYFTIFVPGNNPVSLEGFALDFNHLQETIELAEFGSDLKNFNTPGCFIWYLDSLDLDTLNIPEDCGDIREDLIDDPVTVDERFWWNGNERRFFRVKNILDEDYQSEEVRNTNTTIMYHAVIPDFTATAEMAATQAKLQEIAQTETAAYLNQIATLTAEMAATQTKIASERAAANETATEVANLTATADANLAATEAINLTATAAANETAQQALNVIATQTAAATPPCDSLSTGVCVHYETVDEKQFAAFLEIVAPHDPTEDGYDPVINSGSYWWTDDAIAFFRDIDGRDQPPLLENTTAYEANAFCRKRLNAEGRSIGRLPTVEEWEAVKDKSDFKIAVNDEATVTDEIVTEWVLKDTLTSDEPRYALIDTVTGEAKSPVFGDDEDIYLTFVSFRCVTLP